MNDVASRTQGGAFLGNDPYAQGPLTFTASQASQLDKFVGPSPTSGRIDPKSNVRYNIKSLEKGFSNRPSEIIAKVVNDQFISGTGWWFAICPPTRANMNQQIDIITMDLTSASIAPEGGPYEEVSYSERSVNTKLVQGILGGKMSLQFFARPELDAEKIYNASIRSIANGFWVLARNSVGDAVMGSKNYWSELAATQGVPALTLLKASEAQRTHFAYIQKEPRALSHLAAEARTTMLARNLVPDMAVLPTNTLDGIALSPANTEAFRVGAGKAAKNLALAGKAVEIEGMTVYEDVKVSATNIRPENYSSLEMNIQLGEHNFLGPEMFGDKCIDGSADKQLSTLIYDMDKNGWEPVSVVDIVKKNLDLRFDPVSGEVADHHYNLLQNISSIAKTLGIVDLGEDIDPFIWFSQEARDAGHADGGYFVAELTGEVNPSFLSVDRVRKIAQQIKSSFEKDKVMNDEDLKRIENLIKVAEELSNPPSIDDDTLQAYFAAISFQNNSNGIYLAKNEFGVPNLPSLAVGPSLSVTVGSVEYFVFQLVKHDTTKDEFFQRVVYFFPSAGRYPGKGGVLAADSDTQFGVGNVPVPVTTLPSRPFGYGSLPGLRYLASKKGSLPAAWVADAQVAELGVKVVDDFAKIFSSYFPKTPLSDVSKLPEFLRSGNAEHDLATMIWSSVIFKSVYPFMIRKSAISEAPLYTDAVTASTAPGFVSSLNFSLQTTAGATRVPGVTTNAAAGIVDVFSLAKIGLDAASVQADLIGSAGNLATEIAAIPSILKSRHITERIVAAFNDPTVYRSVNKLFLNLHGHLGALIKDVFPAATIRVKDAFLAELLLAITQLSLPGTSAAVTVDQRASLISALLVYASKPKLVTRKITSADALEIMASPAFGRSLIPAVSDYTPQGGVAVTADIASLALNSGSDETRWKNSRLVLSPSVWTESIQSRDTRFFDINLTRPVDPSSPFRALAASTATKKNKGDNVHVQVTEVLESFAKARKTFHGMNPAYQSMLGFEREEWKSPEEVLEQRANELTNNDAWSSTHSGAYLGANLNQIAGWAAGFSASSTPNREGNLKLIEKKYLRARLNAIDQVSHSHLVRWLCRGILFSSLHQENRIALVERGIAPPFSSFLLVRPFQRVRTASCFFAKSGQNTGRFNWNYAQAYVTMNAAHSEWNMVYIAYLKAVIITPEAIVMFHNVVLKAYRGGRNTVPFTNPDAFGTKDPKIGTASMFVINMGGSFSQKDIPDALSITGVVAPQHFPYSRIADEKNLFARERLQIPIAAFINLFGTHHLNEGRPGITDPHTFQILRANKQFNEITFAGPQINWHAGDQKYSDECSGNSHWSGFGTDRKLKLAAIAEGKILGLEHFKSSAIRD